MHVSLDSALGRQRRLNQVGETISSIAAPTAAYSLRSLTGGDPKVVRVRRESDNHEQDFTASEVSSGALQDFVNAQVVAPLDIQALSATGRDGDFLIAKAAYSLRSLGTRQATLAATGDTVARADGKYVCQVRRSSDDAVKSFTATEVTDGTLLAFTNADYAKYTSDFSSGDDGWGGFDDVTETGNIDGIGGLDNNLRLAIGSVTGQHRGYRNGILPVNQKINFSARVFIPSTNSVVDSLGIRDADGSVIIAAGTTPTQDQWVTVTASNVTTVNVDGQLRVDLQDGGTDSFAGNGSDVVYLREVTVTQVTSDGLVKTWYDQSVSDQAGSTPTGNHATQSTAANQPKIVIGGNLLDELDFDGTDDTLDIDFGADLSQANSFFIVHHSDTTTANSNDLFDSATSANPRTLLDQSGSDYRMFSGGVSAGTGIAVTTDKSLIFALYNGSSSLFAKNGTATSALNAGTTDIKQNSTIGSSNTRFYDGTMQEFIIYNSDQTDNRTAIEANIGEAYSIDLPSGVDPGFDQVDGFVETWYDQSGNGNDATQATAANQPKIVNAGTLLNELDFDGTNYFLSSSNIGAYQSSDGIGFFCAYSKHSASTSDSFTSTNPQYLLQLRKTNLSNTTFAARVLGGKLNIIRANEAGNNFLTTISNAHTIGTNLVLSSVTGTQGVDLFENGSELALSTDDSGVSFDSSSTNLIIGSQDEGTRFIDGNIKELILYTSDQTANRVALETNIISHYGIS
jgi:hypothetical protein